MEKLSLRLSGFRSFVEPQGLEQLMKHNVLVGRNNCGKSAYLLAVAQLFRKETGSGKFSFEFILPDSKEKIKQRQGLDVHLPNFVNASAKGVFPNSGQLFQEAKFVGGEWQRIENFSRGDSIQKVLHDNWPLKPKFHVFHLTAERDILPYSYKDGYGAFLPNGDGFTGLVHELREVASLDSKQFIHKHLLDALNSITKPEYQFTDIDVRKWNEWHEVFLASDQGEFPVSDCGSGLKTILLVLAATILQLRRELGSSAKPVHLDNGLTIPQLDNCVFILEELENNLHPAFLRRLIQYLLTIGNRFSCYFFYSTHSSVLIDIFAGRNDSQVVAVSHDGKMSKVTTVTDFITHRSVLHDMDFRASDILQANVAVWVEGPSDRHYVNRWIELATDGRVQEGLHYQCVFYGGALIEHLSGDDPDKEQKKYVKLLRLCTNCCMLIDSDITKARSILKNGAARLREEVERMGGVVWITKGKEVENYIPFQAINQAIGLKLVSQLNPLDVVFDAAPRGIKSYARRKPEFASKIVPYLELDECIAVLDWSKQIQRFVEHICAANKIDPSTVFTDALLF